MRLAVGSLYRKATLTSSPSFMHLMAEPVGDRREEVGVRGILAVSLHDSLAPGAETPVAHPVGDGVYSLERPESRVCPPSLVSGFRMQFMLLQPCSPSLLHALRGLEPLESLGYFLMHVQRLGSLSPRADASWMRRGCVAQASN